MRSLKSTIVPLTFFICFYTNVQAKKKIEGYYIRFEGNEKVAATFVIPIDPLTNKPNYSRMWEKIEYANGDGKSEILLPEVVSEVHFVYDNKEVVMRSGFDNIHIRKKIFMHLVVDGTVCLYDYYVYAKSYNTGGVKKMISNRALKRKDGEFTLVGEIVYKHNVIVFLSDCPLITDQVKSGALQGLEIIVTKYNAECNH